MFLQLSVFATNRTHAASVVANTSSQWSTALAMLFIAEPTVSRLRQRSCWRVWEFWMRTSSLALELPTSSSSWSMDHTFDLMVCILSFLKDFGHIWLMNYIDNVEQNILFYIEVWSCEMLSLCGKLFWRRNVVFWLCFVYRRRLHRYLMWITSFLRSQSACD